MGLLICDYHRPLESELGKRVTLNPGLWRRGALEGKEIES